MVKFNGLLKLLSPKLFCLRAFQDTLEFFMIADISKELQKRYF